MGIGRLDADRPGRPSGRCTAIALALIVSCGAAGPSDAQGVDCERLRASIRASESDNGQRDSGAFDRAARQQRAEIDRTRRYSAQIGCDRPDFGLFSDGPRPECRDIEDRLSRMQDNLDRMESRADQDKQADGSARHAALVARYNATCVGIGGSPPGLAQNGDAGFLPDDGQNPAFGMPSNPDDLSTVPLNGDIMEGGGDQSHVAGRTICVRTCDGGYFPLAPRATADQLEGLDQLCKASCPNTEARLYTMRGGDLASATANDGTEYTALAAAFKFEKSFTPSCTCKPPNQSWADALAGAEQMLEKGDRRDVVVTTALSDQMAKPLAAPVPAGKGKGAKGKSAPPAAPVPDRRVADEGLRAAQAPTASNESAGIGGPAAAERVLGRADGLKVTTAGPDGVTKQIRLIVP